MKFYDSLLILSNFFLKLINFGFVAGYTLIFFDKLQLDKTENMVFAFITLVFNMFFIWYINRFGFFLYTNKNNINGLAKAYVFTYFMAGHGVIWCFYTYFFS